MSTSSDRVVAVIPARYASTRFPGKPLVPIAGKPMIQRVYERVLESRVDEVIVATDDRRIEDCVEGFGGKVVMTRNDHATGTDRIAEAVCDLDAGIVLNVQGDEPLIPAGVIDELAGLLRDHSAADMATVAVPMADDDPAVDDPNVVKVVRDQAGLALYFSRAPIPWPRSVRDDRSAPLRHWGIYAFRRHFLYQFVSWPQGSLERCEQLEQLRALENGARIQVLISDLPSIGVDVPADVQRAEIMIRELGME